MAVGLAVVVAAAALAGCRPSPDVDAFYTVPADQLAAPGDVLRSRPSVFTLDPIGRTPSAGVRATQVLYRSTSATGGPLTISGTVLVPTAPWSGGGPRPLVAYAVATRGLGDACAPSYSLSQGTDVEALFVDALLERGWAVAVTDLRGLGTPGPHTYEVGQDQGRAVLDAARAAQRLPGSGLDPTGPVGIMGYSQGGTSAGWAAELAGSYAPDLQVVGTAAGGVPADLEAVLAFLDGGPLAGLVLMAAAGLGAAYPELGFESYLNAEGRRLQADSADLCLLSLDVVSLGAGTAFRRLDDFLTTNPIDEPAWQARLAENRLGAEAPNAPVFLYHARFDEVIPYDQAARLRRDWCGTGADVRWKTFYAAEHALGVLQGQGDALAFLADRFAGRPTAPNCSSPWP